MSPSSGRSRNTGRAALRTRRYSSRVPRPSCVAIVRAVEHHLRAALADVCKLADRDRQEVGCECERLSVKVSGGVRDALIAAIPLRPVRAELHVERIVILGKE